ncbi:MAG: heterodisulfide reductase, subunit B [Thermoplasmata archaeon]|nr:MAG: heterodisulfide reductase, subunit B [Thermoplasmata archaeon]
MVGGVGRKEDRKTAYDAGMMKIAYYPGCTLKTTARSFEKSVIASYRVLGIEYIELEKWTCCGTYFSLAKDDLVHHIASIRNLIRVKEAGYDRVVAPCSMCYNTLKMANEEVRNDEEKAYRINSFMDEEEDYRGDVEVLHPFDLLREVGMDRVRGAVKKPLEGLKVMPYYGCMLVRPEIAALGKGELPGIMEDLIKALGGVPVYTPYNIECCGSYHVVSNPDFVMARARDIAKKAVMEGAEVIITSCPLCHYNLDRMQLEAKRKWKDFKEIPAIYFSQLMAIAFGLGKKDIALDGNYVDPRPLFEAKGLV